MSDSATFPLLKRIHHHGAARAISAEDGESSYAELVQQSSLCAAMLLSGKTDLAGARVAFLVPANLQYVQIQLAIWRAGGTAVPLCTLHPAPELDHVLQDSGASTVVYHPSFEELLKPLAMARDIRCLSTAQLLTSTRAVPLPAVPGSRDALLIYTSGTTGKPKGVLTTHDIIAAQLESVTSAWECGPNDRSLLVLPLHHLHGILNILLATLWSGGVCEMRTSFDPNHVWDRISATQGPNVFMAVPTIYSKLIATFDSYSTDEQDAAKAGCRRLRLMVSGSAALPTSVLERFHGISGHTLLERYGMTEIGMALGNPLHGPRRPGHVGIPFPGVRLRIVDDEGNVVDPGTPGHLQVAGSSVFKSYFNRPLETAKAFTPDGYFKTGDEGIEDEGSVRLLGRSSVDIMKTGGFKVSALEIEAVLRTHPDIADCAVVGLPDEEWGQRVTAAIIPKADVRPALDDIRVFCKPLLAAYKIPTIVRLCTAFPRNALGKVQKKLLEQSLQSQCDASSPSSQN